MAMIHKAVTLKKGVGMGYRVASARNIQSFALPDEEDSSINLKPGCVVTSKEAEALIAAGIDVTFR